MGGLYDGLNRSDRKYAADRGFIIKKTSCGMQYGAIDFVIRLLIALAVSYAVVSSIFCVFNIQCDRRALISVVAAAGVLYGVLSLSRVATLFYLAATAYFLYDAFRSNAEAFKVGVKYCANISYKVIAKGLGLPEANGFDHVESGEYLVQSLALMSAVVITMLVVLVIIRLGSAVIYWLCAIAVIGAGAFLERSIPIWMSGTVLCGGVAVTALELSGSALRLKGLKVKRRQGLIKQRLSVAATVQMAVLALVVFGIGAAAVKLCVDKGKYNSLEAPSVNTELKYTLRDIGTMLYIQHLNGVIEDNIGYGQLGFFSRVKPRFSDKLIVEAEPLDEGEKLYLRGYVADIYRYRSNVWSQSRAISNESGFNSVAEYLKSEGAEAKQLKIEIKATNSQRYAYMPYYSSTSDNEAIDYIDDNTVSTDSKEYTVEMYSLDGADVSVNDEEYRQAVYNSCLQLDEGNREVLEQIISARGITKDNISDKLDEYYRSEFEYKLESDVVPYGEDFVNYFLQNSKKGGFAQFATATVLFYRAVGIPARYVGGYEIDAEQIYAGKWHDGVTSTGVKDAQMYSWVEVYRDGVGWQMIDLSPSYSFEELSELYSTKSEESTESTTINIASEYFGDNRELATVIEEKGKSLTFTWAKAVAAVATLLIAVASAALILIRLIKYLHLTRDERLMRSVDRLRRAVKCNDGATVTDICRAAVGLGGNIELADSLRESVSEVLYSGKRADSGKYRALHRDIRRLTAEIYIKRIKS